MPGVMYIVTEPAFSGLGKKPKNQFPSTLTIINITGIFTDDEVDRCHFEAGVLQSNNICEIITVEKKTLPSKTYGIRRRNTHCK